MKRIVRENQKGYSIVEVLVAITILGIVVLPLLRVFVTSANTNAKSRKLLVATTVAENLMEEMKAEGIASILEREKENIALDETTGAYIWTVKDLFLDGKTHHAKVTLDPNTYTGEGTNQYNDAELADIFYMDARQDAAYAESAGARESVLEQYKLRVKPGQSLPSNFEQTLTRTITIMVEASGNMNGDYSTKVKITSKYATTSDVIETGNKEYEEFKDFIIYDSSQSQGKLRGVYLFYNPLYRAGIQTDSIVIENPKEVPLNVYLVRQKTEEENSAKDSTYRANITVKEKSIVASTDRLIAGDPGAIWNTQSTFQASTKICTNINWSLDDVSKKLLSKQGTVTYQRLGSVVRNDQAEQVVQLDGIAPVSKKDRLYEVQVSVYSDGKTETELFEEKNCLVRIDSTIAK